MSLMNCMSILKVSYSTKPYLAWSVTTLTKVPEGRLRVAQQSCGTPASKMDSSRFRAANPELRLISANLFRAFFVKLPQNRHPERSASPIYRVTQHLWRGVEGPRRCLSYSCCSELFNHRRPSPDLRVSFEDYEDI